MRSRSGSDALSASAVARPTASKNSFAVPAEFARPTWASAKPGSFAAACWKYGRASVARSFSTRSRPLRYSCRASSDEVVMGILSAAAAALAARTTSVHAAASRVAP